MRLFIFMLIIAIATVLTGGWVWLAVGIWLIYAICYKVYKYFGDKARIR